MIYNKVRKHEVARLREHIGILLMVEMNGIQHLSAADTSSTILTEVHCNG